MINNIIQYNIKDWYGRCSNMLAMKNESEEIQSWTTIKICKLAIYFKKRQQANNEKWKSHFETCAVDTDK